ncbi:MAG: glycosyltransferase family 4 protein [Acidobacteriota bacterium]
MNEHHKETAERKGKRRLWVVTELYYPEETSTGYYLTRIAEGLADVADVHVICGQPNYSARGTVAPSRERHNDVEIYRVAGTRLDKNVIAFRVVNMITLGVSIFFKALVNIRRGDRILAVTTPPSLPYVIAVTSLIKGGSYTLLIHDNYPEILVAANKTKPDSVVVRVNHFLNRWLYKYAARIIVVGRDMEALVSKKAAGLDIPISTIPNWGEIEDVRPTRRDENRLLDELGLKDKFVFLYAGNMGHPNDLESIVQAASELNNPDIHFLFLGTGAKRKWLENYVLENHLSNVSILDPRPRSDQIDFLNACDVAIVSLVSRMWGVSMPSRTYNILAAGKPILALTDEGSEVALTISDDDIGWTVPPEDAGKFAAAVNQIYTNRASLPAMGIRARGAAEKRFGQASAIDNYRRLFQ